jgi:hypothetical protein
MAEDPRTYTPSTPQANRARMQGAGVGQKEMNVQRDPNRDVYATNPQRTEPFGHEAEGGGDDLGADNGRNAMGTGNSTERTEPRSFAGEDAERADEGDRRDSGGLDPSLSRNEAGVREVGDLGAGTPANVDVRDLGQKDHPEQEWGEAQPGAVYGANHTRRPVRTEAERGQGAKTRKLNKDIISRRT